MLDTIELTPEQNKEVINVHQLFGVYQERMAHASHFKGSMSWKTIKGKDYLYKKVSGKNKSLGARSPDTEYQFSQFSNGKAAARQSVNDIYEQMKVQARYAKAARINRVPLIPANIIRKIQKNGLADQILVIGTHALYGYEAMASKYIIPSLMETSDIDFLWDKRMPLKIACNHALRDGLMHIIQSVDRSFEKTASPYRAANKSGFMVDLVSDSHDLKELLPTSIGHSEYDLKSASIGSLKWLINSPRVSSNVIDSQGLPLSMQIPDPRCFAIHKAWLSKQPSRDSNKMGRDLQQASVVTGMIMNDMAGFEFTEDQLLMFPYDVRMQAKNNLHLDDDWMPAI